MARRRRARGAVPVRATAARVPSKILPSVWLEPSIVVEVLADEITSSPNHTAGYALRFPRVIRFRDADKRPEDATTLAEAGLASQAQRGRPAEPSPEQGRTAFSWFVTLLLTGCVVTPTAPTAVPSPCRLGGLAVRGSQALGRARRLGVAVTGRLALRATSCLALGCFALGCFALGATRRLSLWLRRRPPSDPSPPDLRPRRARRAALPRPTRLAVRPPEQVQRLPVPAWPRTARRSCPIPPAHPAGATRC